ncbi:MAG: CHC2 zinc finger domain-containing protein [Cyclobacteriaceae bacterium]
MEIAEIKQQLTISQVLDHYSLSTDKNNMLCCPFHNDKTPSLQIYPQTNTFCCFSSNCKAGTGDVIEFIRLMEKSTKREAILKAKSLLGFIETKANQPEELSRVAVLARYLEGCRKGMSNGERARVYATGRGLDWQTLKLGFTGEKVPEGWNKQYKESAAAIGLISKTQDGRYLNRFKNCLVFALQNVQGHTVGIYGRSVSEDPGTGKHYYLPGPHQGLYPAYPGAETKKLILTEAIIDAATLHQLTTITSEYTVLACYGTNGFIQEHEQAIRELKHLEEVILFFDGDEAGREGTKKVTAKLQEIRKDITISQVNTPEGEDVNSLAQAHEKEIFTHLIEKRVVIFSPEGVPGRVESKSTATPTNSYKLEIFPHRFLYRTATANYHIKGELHGNFESLRVSLDIEHPQNGRKSRSKIDLYEDKQVDKLARDASDKLGLRADMIQLDLEELTSLLEAHREKQSQNKEPATSQGIQVPLHLEGKCKEFLSKPNLIRRLNDLIGQAGVVGEETNRIFLFGIASSYKMPETLHALIQGSSGSGKTHLLAKVSSFIPKEGRKAFTRVTEGSLYNYGMYDLSHQLICIEDLDGMKEEAQLAFRELQSKGVIISSTSSKDEHGNVNAYERIVYGPIASMACTTKGEIYEDNMSRCFLIAVDESHEQTIKIIQYQNKKSAGQIDEKREQQITEFLQHCIRLLKPCQVINPYADKVHLPEEAHKIRRLNGLYQAFVKQITLLHQYQRKTDAQGRLISEKEDLQIAAEIMFESIVLKVDELDGSLRQFYERLKQYVKTKGNSHYQSYEFNQREIRQALHISKSQLHRYIQDLLALEYIRQAGGYINRGFNYKVLYWDNIQALRAKVKRHLQGQLDQLELITV